MKKIIVVNIFLMLIFYIAWADEVAFEKLKLGLTIPKKTFFGEDFNLTVTLKSDIEQSINSLETADLVIEIRKINESVIQYTCKMGDLRDSEINK